MHGRESQHIQAWRRGKCLPAHLHLVPQCRDARFARCAVVKYIHSHWGEDRLEYIYRAHARRHTGTGRDPGRPGAGRAGGVLARCVPSLSLKASECYSLQRVQESAAEGCPPPLYRGEMSPVLPPLLPASASPCPGRCLGRGRVELSWRVLLSKGTGSSLSLATVIIIGSRQAIDWHATYPSVASVSRPPPFPSRCVVCVKVRPGRTGGLTGMHAEKEAVP